MNKTSIDYLMPKHDLGNWDTQVSKRIVCVSLQGLDIIIGKDWMSRYDGQIDHASKAITLTTPEKKRIRYQFKSRSKETNWVFMRILAKKKDQSQWKCSEDVINANSYMQLEE